MTTIAARTLATATALARAPEWAWHAGMRSTAGRMFVRYADEGAVWLDPGSPEDGCDWETSTDQIPDLDDPSTVGWLLRMFDEVDGLGLARTVSMSSFDRVTALTPSASTSGPSAGVALGVALLTAWAERAKWGKP